MKAAVVVSLIVNFTEPRISLKVELSTPCWLRVCLSGIALSCVYWPGKSQPEDE